MYLCPFLTLIDIVCIMSDYRLSKTQNLRIGCEFELNCITGF